MVDVTKKPQVYREAVAKGVIRLRRETVKAIAEARVEKGDVLTAAQLAAIMAAKRTPELIPLCHPIPITDVDVGFRMGDEHLEVEVKVRAVASTGVEMEALTAASVALLTVWDMVKGMEKDEEGQYPFTEIASVKIESKVKGVEGVSSREA
ncbi:MAG: cyclic pyranopterin monophosphate synthase MoaC [Candidatus Nezhaarchaeota archaeon]|nr:cyclic pyranopterin monophosphate synthase MoaC [Candidatus Nezhaarchaeota archaeon]